MSANESNREPALNATPLFAVTKLDADDAFCASCSLPAEFSVNAGPNNATFKFCCNCAVAYALQAFKLNGVELAAIAEVFPKLSAALEAPLASSMVQ